MTLIGLMTAILCITAPVSFVLPFSPVPVSLGTLAIYFSLYVLGMKRGTISLLLYLLLGLAGLPVFSNFTGGAGKLWGPTGGYLTGYIFMALISGFFIDRWSHSVLLSFVGMASGTAACYLFGSAWLSCQASMTFSQALAVGAVPFIPADLLKMIVALFLGKQVRRRVRIIL